MKDSTRELIDKIKSIRKEKGLSQIELAKRCNVPQSTIGRIENHSMNPSLDIITTILDVLNLKIDLSENRQIKKGYDVFGKAYGIMTRNDTHDVNSIEHKLFKERVKLDEVSEPFLYGGYQIYYPMENHELYAFSKQFKKSNGLDTVKEVIGFTSKIASEYDTPIEDMLFGGTEKEILERKTDWCFDLARLSAVILDSLNLTSRIIFVANPDKAYYGHVLLEVYYNDCWGTVDPTYGYVFIDKKPVSVKDIWSSKQFNKLDDDYKNMFKQIAVADYNPIEKDNRYIVSKCNDYTLRLNTMEQDGSWKFNEDL